MAKQIINVGSLSNDRTGDSLRTGAVKINSNFTELYNNNATIFDRLYAGANVSLSKSGGNCIITASVPLYMLPVSNTVNLGGVKVDGTTIQINGNGVISAHIVNITGNAGTVTNGVYTTINYDNPSWINSLAYSKLLGAPATYTLPIASASNLGGVKVDGDTIQINATTGVISGAYSYTLPIASASNLGGVTVDGDTIQINATTGVISLTSPPYGLPIASASNLGGVMVDGTTIQINPATGMISGAYSYTLPVATDVALGGVKIDNLSITISDGVISSNGGTLPSRVTASVTTSSLAVNGAGSYTITGFKGYALLSIQTSAAAWVSIYSSTAAQTADSSRAITTDPAPGTGVIAEAINLASGTQHFSPAVIGYNNEATPTTAIPIKVYNNGGSAAAITVTLTLLRLEA